MWRGQSFDELLDGKLGAEGHRQPGAPPFAPSGSEPFVPHPLLFDEPQLRFGAFAYGWKAAAGPSTPPRPTRVLTPAAREALAALIDLGARLTIDFTAGELRSAFRALARRVHPDRHPFSTDVERARLGRVFAELNTHYRLLQSAIESEPREAVH